MNGFLLVGGQGRRMGGAKATRLFAGRPLWRYGYQLLQPFCAQVKLVGLCAELDFPTLVEDWPGQGPLGAVLCALQYSLPESPWNLVLALDYPLLRQEIVQALLPPPGSAALARLPRCQGQSHPLCGFYHRAAAVALGGAFAAGERSLLKALELLGNGLEWVDFADSEPFLNVNRPQDLQ